MIIALARLITAVAKLIFSLSILMFSPPLYASIILFFVNRIKWELAIFLDFIALFSILAK